MTRDEIKRIHDRYRQGGELTPLEIIQLCHTALEALDQVEKTEAAVARLIRCSERQQQTIRDLQDWNSQIAKAYLGEESKP